MHKAIKTVLIMALAVSAANSLRAQTLTGVDVGFPSQPGSTTLAAGQYTVVGGGNDIWGSSDNFHYAYTAVTGDFDYIVKVVSLTGNANDGGWSKAELMAREPDSSGAPQGTDRFIANMVTREGGQNEVALQWRSDSGTAVSGFGSGCAWPNDIGIGTPLYRPTPPNTWIRLERMGARFWAYASPDGTAWTLLRGSPYDTGGLNGNEAAPRTDGAFLNNLLIGLAVTAHSDADTSTGVFTDFRAWTPVPLAITTQPPATLDAAANSTVTISVVTTGDPVHYEWRKDGVAIPTTNNASAGTASLSLPLVQLDQSGSYTVRCFGVGQTEVISEPCVVTITVDATPPSVTEAKPLASSTSLRVTFSEPVTSATATVPGNYTFTGGVTATAAALSADGYSVTLVTTPQALNTQYTLTVTGVQDTAIPANTIAAPGNTATFTSVMLLTGYAFYERWQDANGDLGDINAFATAIADGSARVPDVTAMVSQLGCPWGAADNYNARVRAYFTPPSAGNYAFFVAADDGARVFLSTDDNPLNKKLICQEANWSNQYNWNIDASLEQSSLTFDGSEWPSGPYTYIALAANTKYFIEGLVNEGGGGDGLDITFIKEGDANPPQDATGMFMKGDVISWYESPDVLPPTIVTHPADNVTIDAGGTATLSVVANNPAAGALTYQWTHNGRDIAGATSADYTISNADALDNGQYRCKVSNKNATLWTGDGAPNPTVVMVKGTGVFNIEAEDFDYASGQTMPAASVMPYVGGAYAGLVDSVQDVDYHNLDGTDAVAYRPFPAGQNAQNSSETGGQWTMTRADEWTMTANYKIGWVGTGDWGNYTRTFPTPAKPYWVFAAQSNDNVADGGLHSTLGIVTAGGGTTTQTVTPVGVFDAQGTGDWSRNNLVVMTETAGGAVKTVELGGTHIIRWNYDNGDADYLIFYPASTVTTPTIGVGTNPQGQPVLTFTGTLLGAGAVTGPYTPVAGATSPFTVTGGAGTMQFYRSSQ